MSPWTLVAFAAFINWISTTILVESSLFAGIRERILRWGVVLVVEVDGKTMRLPPTGDIASTGLTQEQLQTGRVEHTWYSLKCAQLVTCIMCLGVWVGVAEALVLGTPWHHIWYAVPAAALLYKAGGHFLYELRSRVAKP